MLKTETVFFVFDEKLGGGLYSLEVRPLYLSPLLHFREVLLIKSLRSWENT